MPLIWMKRIVLCSATFTGGYITLWPKYPSLKFSQKNEGISSETEELDSYIYLPTDIGNDFEKSVECAWNWARKVNIPIYWKLYMLCKSKDMKVRHKAIETLSKSSLEKWEYEMIAQACDIDTSIGLARSVSASPHFFRTPPFRDLEKGNLQNELYQILLSLLTSDVDVCTKSLVKQVEKSAKYILKGGYSWDLEVGDPSVIYHSQQKKKALFLYDKLCLEAILICSSRSIYRNIMMKKGILNILLKVWISHRTDIKIHSLIAQILANFALEEKFRKDIFMTGWIGILAEWMKSPVISINLPAAKTLANLDSDDIAHPLYDDGVFVLNSPDRLSQRDILVDVIFIHGLRGATFWTWRQCDTQKITNKSISSNKESNHTPVLKYSMCWPKDWLAADIPYLRIMSVDYKTCLSSWSSCCYPGKEKDSISRRANEIIQKLLLANVGERPIIWIAHSMGGLIVKEILTGAFHSKDERIQNLAKKTAGMVLYSVPHKGTEIANKINSASLILPLSNDITELIKGSSYLLLLHEKFKEFVSKCDIPVLSFGEDKKSHWGLGLSVLVPPDSADPGLGEFHTLPVDHLSTCKPQSSKSSDYIKVLNFMQDIILNISSTESCRRRSPEKIFEISKMLSLIP